MIDLCVLRIPPTAKCSTARRRVSGGEVAPFGKVALFEEGQVRESYPYFSKEGQLTPHTPFSAGGLVRRSAQNLAQSEACVRRAMLARIETTPNCSAPAGITAAEAASWTRST